MDKHIKLSIWDEKGSCHVDISSSKNSVSSSHLFAKPAKKTCDIIPTYASCRSTCRIPVVKRNECPPHSVQWRRHLFTTSPKKGEFQIVQRPGSQHFLITTFVVKQKNKIKYCITSICTCYNYYACERYINWLKKLKSARMSQVVSSGAARRHITTPLRYLKK